MKVYHGSPNKFDDFDYAKIGAQGSSEGHGFYFTTSRVVASHYAQGGYLYEIEFHGKKQLSLDKLTIHKKAFKKILEEIDFSGSDYLSNWGDIHWEGYFRVLDQAVEGLYYEGPGANDADLIASLINSAGSSEIAYRILYEEFGYDHILARRESDGPDQTVYVATVPEAFTILKVVKYEG